MTRPSEPAGPSPADRAEPAPAGASGVPSAPSAPGPRRSPTWARAAAALLLVLAIAAGDGVLRARRALAHPALDRAEAASVVRSDPALLLHLTEAVRAADGVPADWHADPRIEHPDTLDVPRVFTVGLEFVVRACAGFLDPLVLRPGDGPHVRLLWVTSLLAALASVGVAWVGREATGSWGWGAVAAALHATLPAAHRTLGLVALREDLALPLLALHLGCLLRAWRTGGAASWTAAGLLAGLALATWHGTGMLLLVEAAAGLVALVVARPGAAAPDGIARSPRGPRPSGPLPRAAALGLLALVAVSLAVPALRAKGGPLSAPVAAWIGLGVAGVLGRGRALRLGLALGVPAILFGLGTLGADGAGDLSHVAALLWAKLEHLGARPASPAGLPFEARMMWQGPFATLTVGMLVSGLQALALAVPVALGYALLGGPRGRAAAAGSADDPARRAAVRWAATLLLLGLGAAWLAARMLVLPALLAPVVAVVALRDLARHTPAPLDRMGPAAILALHGILYLFWLGGPPTSWHDPERARAAVAAVRAVEAHVPAGAAVAADFVTGPTVLACTGRPVPLSPKWERRASRARVERFWTVLHFGTPEGFRAHLRDDLRCEYLLVDRRTMFTAAESRWLAGYDPRELEPRPGTAAAALLAPTLDAVPEGYELLWTGEPRPTGVGAGEVPGWYQLYRLAD